VNHIQNIEIQNFKSIRHCTIDGCKRINVFVGPPNVGKSNILEAISIAQIESIEINENFTLDQYIRYEKNYELLYNGDTQNDIEIVINDFIFRSYFTNKFIHFTGNHIENDKEDFVSVVNEPGTLKLPFNIKKYLYLENPLVVNSKSTLALDFPYGSNLFSVLKHNSTLRNILKDYLNNNNLKLLFNQNTDKLKLAKFLDNDTIFEIPLISIADSFKRLIFHLAAIKTNNDTVLLFEEPESHCYEPYILDITNAIKFDEQNNQYFIVTHSDYIVTEFLRDEESRNNTNIYLVGLDDDGSTKAKLLDREKSEDVYQYGTNVFFNYEALWNENV
jgi:AAA15 family ATPase/GTPase